MIRRNVSTRFSIATILVVAISAVPFCVGWRILHFRMAPSSWDMYLFSFDVESLLCVWCVVTVQLMYRSSSHQWRFRPALTAGAAWGMFCYACLWGPVFIHEEWHYNWLYWALNVFWRVLTEGNVYGTFVGAAVALMWLPIAGRVVRIFRRGVGA